jgi:hypothetical protein
MVCPLMSILQEKLFLVHDGLQAIRAPLSFVALAGPSTVLTSTKVFLVCQGAYVLFAHNFLV